MTGDGRPTARETVVPRPLVHAAVRSFAAGYGATSLRRIAADAGLDPAVVGESFSSKDRLFSEVATAVIDPVKAVAAFSEGTQEHAGERLLRYFLTLLADVHQPGMLLGLIRCAVGSEEAARVMREFLAERIHGEIAAALPADRPELRTALAASQLVGIAITRHVIGLPPLVAADPDELVTWVAPVLRNYLIGSAADQADTPHSWYGRFRLLLAEAVDHGSPSLGAVAQRMAVSTRTLQRQLAAHGTTWRAELDELRRSRAQQAHHDGTVSVGSLARHLGYSDPRSARRALRRWDIPPGEPCAPERGR